jgi:hypothetical protein
VLPTQVRADEAGMESKMELQVATRRLLCVECETESDERARGWRAYVGGGFDGDEVEVGTYCPACAEAEFGA